MATVELRPSPNALGPLQPGEIVKHIGTGFFGLTLKTNDTLDDHDQMRVAYLCDGDVIIEARRMWRRLYPDEAVLLYNEKD